MAAVTASTSYSIDIVDLTSLSDGECEYSTPRHSLSPTTHHATLPTRPSPAIKLQNPNHGLILSGTFALARPTSRHDLPLSPEGARRPRARLFQSTVPSTRQADSQEIGLDRSPVAVPTSVGHLRERRGPFNSVSSITNPNKRRRIIPENAVYGPQLHSRSNAPISSVECPPKEISEYPIETDNAGSHWSVTAAGRIGRPAVDHSSIPGLETLGAGEARPNDPMGSENLRLVLNWQVFKYIHKELLPYAESLDGPTRLRLGKEVASHICDDDFSTNLELNNGRLSALYESQVASEVTRMVYLFATRELDDRESMISGTRGDSSRTPLISLRALSNPRAFSSERRGSPDLQQSEYAQDAHPELLVILSDSENQDMDECFRQYSPSLIPGDVHQGAHQYTSSPTTAVSLEMPKQVTDTVEDVCSLATRHCCVFKSNPILESPDEAPSLPRPRRNRFVKAAFPTKEQETHLLPAELSACFSERTNLMLAGLDLNTTRPYFNVQARADLVRGLSIACPSKYSRLSLSVSEKVSLNRAVAHVDFSTEEVEYVNSIIRSVFHEMSPKSADERTSAQILMYGKDSRIPQILKACSSRKNTDIGSIGARLVARRTKSALRSFLQDAAAGQLSKTAAVVRVEPSSSFPPAKERYPNINASLFQRSIYGKHPGTRFRTAYSFEATLTNLMEDTLSRRAEWTDCAGDVATIAWTPNGGFVCGATAHLDSHNMQYNKPGNLVVGSAFRKDVTSIPGHRISRPLVQKGDNALPSMRQTQDPWLYCSVTSIGYSEEYNRCFTGGFDGTVKIWELAENGSSMDLKGTWEHDGHVNFVMTSLHHGLIATASDVGQDAIRVYELNERDVSNSSYDTYSGEKAEELAMARRQDSEVRWAYHPATMAWGKSPSVAHLLLVGYSPRSYDCEDTDIPEDKAKTGELCLWSMENGERIPITTARTQNVFEVVWHPALPIFVAATSPLGEFADGVRTQLRLFGQSSTGTFTLMKTLDCMALDINEITVMPNGNVNSYVTASCTDGKTYVWDTAQSDKPMHILCHGDSIDIIDPTISREEWDVGVKFAAWGQTADRFYTGSSDGVVKAWNIRAPPGEEHLRDILSLSGGVAAGSWSPDFSNLLIGDSTGKIHLLSVEDCDTDLDDDSPIIHKPITPHTSIPLSISSNSDLVEMDETAASSQTAQEIAREFLDNNQIILNPDPYIGAIQGPAYGSTGLFCATAHKNNNPFSRPRTKYLQTQLARYDVPKQFFPRLDTQGLRSSDSLLHAANCSKDLVYEALDPEVKGEMRREGVDFDTCGECVHGYGEEDEGDELRRLDAFVTDRLELLRGLRGLFQSLAL